MTYQDLYKNYTPAERKEAHRQELRAKINGAMADRDAYLDFVSSRPAAIYNVNVEIYQAELERRNAEIDNLIAEQDADEAGDLTAMQYGDKWLGELPPAKITTLQGLAGAKERSFNRRYYNNPNGEPKFVYNRSNR